MFQQEQIEAIKRTLKDVLDSTTQDSVQEIELNLTSRAILHLNSDGATFPVAVTVVPTLVKYSDYKAVADLQPTLNLVLDNLSRDREFIVSCLYPIAQHDPFVKGLMDIYTSLPDSNLEKVALGLHRNDFMYQTLDPTKENAFLNGHFKLVEVNLAAASMGHYTENTYHFHQSLLNLQRVDCQHYKESVEINQGLAEGLKLGREMYNAKNQITDTVVVLVQDSATESNYFDMQGILNKLSRLGVPTVRHTISHIVTHGYTKDGRYYLGDREVAVFYLRTLYDPRHFINEDYWRVRREMEHSQAITVPNIRHQIVNMKVFQMHLAQRPILSRYCHSHRMEEDMISLFTDTLPLDLDEEGDLNAKLGIDYPDLYVMKPQREGGGNNLWELEMKEKLLSLAGDPARSKYILMRRFTPPVLRNKFIRNSVLSEEVDTVSEIGLFSVFCTDSDGTVLQNKVVGPLVRTKKSTDNEGGVAVGISAIDSPFFV